MKQYLELAKNILNVGIKKSDRTGTGTVSKFGRFMRFDIRDGRVPLLTTKEVNYELIIHTTK